MFIKTLVAFVFILLATKSPARNNRKKSVSQPMVCSVTELEERGDTLYAVTNRYGLDVVECEAQAKLACSPFTLRVEYVWDKNSKKEIRCEVTK